MSQTTTRTPIEHRVETAKGHLHVDEYPGDGPAVIMTHGYPDDSRIYRHLVPTLESRRLVTFDFLGYGRSGREAIWPLEPGQRESELGAVIEALELDLPVLVGHDSGGPVVINFCLDNPGRISHLLLLNTYYGQSPTQEFPELIRLLADPHLTPFANAIMADQNILGWALNYTDSRLRGGQAGPPDPTGVGYTVILPQFFGDAHQPPATAAIRAWTAELFQDIAVQEKRLAAGDIQAMDTPVTLAFGANDPYFDPAVAGYLQTIFPKVDRHEIADAAHWPQWDQPAQIAAIIANL